jgi:hypothetical protein
LGKICLPQWRLPLSYGWYCGAGRPIDPSVAFKSNPVLDPVDYCCVLHDQQVWYESPDAAPDLAEVLEGQQRNACGAAMCFGQVAFSQPDVASFLPQVEHARRKMYEMSMLLCQAPSLADEPELVLK